MYYTMLILAALLVLGIVVFVHELGHFLVAKWFKVTVEVFSIGFGPRLFGIKRGGTDYRVSVLPWGGYVKLAGEMTTEGETPQPGEFMGKPPHQRIAVLLAGAGFNFLLALLLYSTVFWYGIDEPYWETRIGNVIEEVEVDEQPYASPAAQAGLQSGDWVRQVNGRSVGDWQELLTELASTATADATLRIERNGEPLTVTVALPEDVELFPGIIGIQRWLEPVIGAVEDGYPAAAAGLQVGDRIVMVNGTAVRSWNDMLMLLISNGHQEFTLTVDRAGEELSFTLMPHYDQRYERSRIGIAPPDPAERFVHYSFPRNIWYGALKTWEVTKMSVVGIYKLVTMQLKLKAMGGPIMIVTVAATVAQFGLLDLAMFVGLISVSLGVVNLFPLPPTDGGIIILNIAEVIYRKRLPERIVNTIQMTGIYLVLTLFVVVIYNDMERFGWLSAATEWIIRSF